MMFLWIPLLVLVAWGFGWLIRRDADPACCTPSHGHVRPSEQTDPLGLARTRLAKGEITVAQYDEIRRALGL